MNDPSSCRKNRIRRNRCSSTPIRRTIRAAIRQRQRHLGHRPLHRPPAHTVRAGRLGRRPLGHHDGLHQRHHEAAGGPGVGRHLRGVLGERRLIAGGVGAAESSLEPPQHDRPRHWDVADPLRLLLMHPLRKHIASRTTYSVDVVGDDDLADTVDPTGAEHPVVGQVQQHAGGVADAASNIRHARGPFSSSGRVVTTTQQQGPRALPHQGPPPNITRNGEEPTKHPPGTGPRQCHQMAGGHR